MNPGSNSYQTNRGQRRLLLRFVFAVAVVCHVMAGVLMVVMIIQLKDTYFWPTFALFSLGTPICVWVAFSVQICGLSYSAIGWHERPAVPESLKTGPRLYSSLAAEGFHASFPLAGWRCSTAGIGLSIFGYGDFAIPWNLVTRVELSPWRWYVYVQHCAPGIVSPLRAPAYVYDLLASHCPADKLFGNQAKS